MPSRTLLTADDRREAVIVAATAAFAARGYFGANTTEIAEAAGISQAYVYRLYANKEALFIAALNQAARRVRDDLDLALASASSQSDAEQVLLQQRVRSGEAAALLLQATTACSVPVIAEAVRHCYAEQWRHLQDHGLATSVIRDYFARAQLASSIRLAEFPVGDPVAEALTY